MKVVCPQCNSTIPAAKIDVSDVQARCPGCAGWIDVAIAVETAEARTGRAPPWTRIEKGPAELLIAHRWLSWDLAFFLPFALFWNGFLVFWYSVALGSGDLVMILFPILHVGIGVFLAYMVIGRVMNKSVVRADADFLHVDHGPIPWWDGRGNRLISQSVPLDEVERFASFTSGGRVRLRRWKPNGQATTDFCVSAVLKSGEQIPLFVELNDVKHARWLECFLNDFLGVGGLSEPVVAREAPK